MTSFIKHCILYKRPRVFFKLSQIFVSNTGTETNAIIRRAKLELWVYGKSERLVCDMRALYLSQWELSAWLCSVTRLSSSSSSMRNGCKETGSSWGHEYLCRYGWDKAASAVSRSMGLKVRIHSRKSMPEIWSQWIMLLMYDSITYFKKIYAHLTFVLHLWQ